MTHINAGSMTRVESLALALKLAITAPDDTRSQQAVTIANQLALGMSPGDVANAKKLAYSIDPPKRRDRSRPRKVRDELRATPSGDGKRGR